MPALPTPFRYNRRRAICLASAALVSGAFSGHRNPARAIEPIQRGDAATIKLGLAAYSLRSAFQKKVDPTTGDDAPANQRLDLRGFIDYCAQQGVDGAELTQYYFPTDVTREQLFQIKRHAHLQGIDISGGAIGNNFTHSAGAESDRQMEYVRTWIHHYADLGAPVIRIFAGSPESGVTPEIATQRAIRNIQTACQLAGERGVLLAIENHDFTTDVNRLLEIVQSVDSPWLGINFDSGNLHHSQDPYADMERMAPFAVNAQIKVKIHQADGKVDADLPRIVRILRNAGYGGYLVLEYEEPDPYQHIPKYLDQLRVCLSNGAE